MRQRNFVNDLWITYSYIEPRNNVGYGETFCRPYVNQKRMSGNAFFFKPLKWYINNDFYFWGLPCDPFFNYTRFVIFEPNEITKNKISFLGFKSSCSVLPSDYPCKMCILDCSILKYIEYLRKYVIYVKHKRNFNIIKFKKWFLCRFGTIWGTVRLVAGIKVERGGGIASVRYWE